MLLFFLQLVQQKYQWQAIFFSRRFTYSSSDGLNDLYNFLFFQLQINFYLTYIPPIYYIQDADIPSIYYIQDAALQTLFFFTLSNYMQYVFCHMILYW